MPMSQVTARVGVGMTTLLTLVSMYSGVRQSTPDVSYVSYLDIWMMICLLCVISFIFEFIIITHLINKQLYPEESFEKFETWFRIFFPVCFLTVSGLFWAMIFYYHWHFYSLACTVEHLNFATQCCDNKRLILEFYNKTLTLFMKQWWKNVE